MDCTATHRAQPRVAARVGGVAVVLLIMVGSAHAQKVQVPTAPTTQPGSAPTARTLTIDEAVAVGLRNSKALQIATAAVVQARGRVSESRAGYNPSLSATGTFTHLSTATTVTLPAGQGGEDQTFPLTVQNQKAVLLGATLPVDITGLIGAAVEQSQFAEIATRLDYNRTRNEAVLNIKNAYYNVLRAKASLGVAQQALSNAEERASTAQKYLDAGTGTRFDVLRAQTDVANARQGVIAARNQVNLTTATLNNVLGLDQNTPTETVETPEATPPAEDFNGDTAEAYRIRPEVLQADANIRAAEKGVRVAQRSALPTFGVTWGLNYTPDAGGFSSNTSAWQAVATVSVPIYDQGVSRARVTQARAGVDTAKLNKQVALDSVALEVRQAALAYTEAVERLSVARTALTEAEEQYRLARVRYEEGVTQTPGGSPLLEISDAQTALTQAQTNLVNARYDVQNARARVDRAVGRYSYETGSNPGLPAPTQGGKK